MMIPLGMLTERLRNLYNLKDGLILSGGGDVHPKNYRDNLKGLCKQIGRDLAPEMRKVEVSSDGIIEAAEISNHPYALGIQWHPEWIQDTSDQKRLFSRLVNTCRNGII